MSYLTAEYSGPPACEHCRFFKADPPLENGDCRAHPPMTRLSGGDNPVDGLKIGYFPITHKTDWCGEYQPKRVTLPLSKGKEERSV